VVVPELHRAQLLFSPSLSLIA